MSVSVSVSVSVEVLVVVLVDVVVGLIVGPIVEPIVGPVMSNNPDRSTAVLVATPPVSFAAPPCSNSNPPPKSKIFTVSPSVKTFPSVPLTSPTETVSPPGSLLPLISKGA